MPKIAIDIVLLPPEEIMDKAIAINKQLTDDPIQLDKVTCLPHISLCMGVVEEENLSAINKIIDGVWSQFTALSLTINKIHGTQAGFDIEITDDIQKLHETVMTELSPYLSYEATPAMCYPNPPVVEKTVSWINKYKESSSFENFYPHITLGISPVEGDDAPIHFVASQLAVCHLGNYCTCRKILHVVNLKLK